MLKRMSVRQRHCPAHFLGQETALDPAGGVYRSNLLLYSSSTPEEQMDTEEESPAYDWVSYYQVRFSDGEADVVIYANDTYHWFSILLIAALILAFLLFPLIFLSGFQDLVRLRSSGNGKP